MSRSPTSWSGPGIDATVASFAARASQGHIGRARALCVDEGTRSRRREIVSLPARLTSIGSCMTAATNLNELAKEETEAITAETEQRELKELQAIFGSERKDLASRSYKAALSGLEKLQKQKAKRRVLDVIDRALMDLVSVYRDAIALSMGAPGLLVNEELRGDVATLARGGDARGAAAHDRRDLHRPRADAGVQRAATAGPGVDDRRAAPARGPIVKKVVAVVAVLALALTAFVAVGLAVQGFQSDDSAPSARPTPVPDDPAAGVGHAAADARAGRLLLPAHRLGALREQRRPGLRHAHRARSTTPSPAGETLELSLLRVPATGARVGSMVVNPGGPGARGTSYAAAAGQVFREPLLEGFDIVGFDPRGVGRSDPVDCLTDAELDDYLAGDPTPDTPAEVADYKAVGAVLRRPLRRRVRADRWAT